MVAGRVRRALRAAGFLLLPLLLTGCAARAPAVPPPARPSPPPAAPSAAHQLAERLSGFIWPLPIESTVSLTSAYGARWGRHHDGLDLGGRGGDPIYAASDGRVLFSGWRGAYGQTVILDHGGGVTTLYAHASALFVATGERIERGQPIAAVGATGNATGNHLHFEVRWAGYPIDPTFLLPRLRGR